jgi:FixJ family two-component response regulator
MAGLSGLDLQKELAKVGVQIPVIFITAYGNIPMAVQAMKAGAVEFLTKPFREQALLDAIRYAIKRDRTRREHEAKLADLRTGYELLTAHEREVMPGVVSGMLNKQIARELRTTERTIKFHRAHIIRKMEAQSLALAGSHGGPSAVSPPLRTVEGRTLYLRVRAPDSPRCRRTLKRAFRLESRLLAAN